MMKKFIILYFLIFIIFNSLFSQEDVVGSKDHPLISRYPGSYIKSYSQKEYDEYYILLSPVKSSHEKDIKNAKKKRVTGKVTKILYQCPKRRSNFEVFENYKIAIREAGFEILYEDKGENLRGAHSFLAKMNREYTGGWFDPERYGPFYYLSACSPDKNIFVSLLVRGHYDGPIVNLSIIEKKEMEKGLITAKKLITAKNMLEQLSLWGYVSIYTIYFDFNKADIKPESQPTLDEIAKLLKENPDLKLYIVGHTDNIGSIDYNLDLSRRRAEAVVKELVEKHRISKDRLEAYGVGPLAPCASNKTEKGRAKNRRVELVEK